MFYLSKYFGKQVKEEAGRYELGFVLEPVEGEVVEQNSALYRGIVKLGNEYVYAIGAGLQPLSAQELKALEEAKAKVVSTIAASNEEISLALLDMAKELAKDSLLGKVDPARIPFFSYLLAHATVGYGPISMLMEDKASIEEIEINAPAAPIAVECASYGHCKTNTRISGERWFRHFINRMAYEVEKDLSSASPILDAQIENSRVHAQIRPYAQSGGVATIRLSSAKRAGISYLLEKGSVDEDVLAYIWLAIDAGANIVIAGAPASGKTTLLNALLSFVPKYQRVIAIEEDVNELSINSFENIVCLYGSKYGKSITVREQVINALRMRPNRLVVGEIRNEEAKELFSGANLGVPFITTMHSNEGAVSIIKKLMVKPMEVDQRAITMLDLALYMKQIDINKRVLASAYEYKWLSRAEADGGINLGNEDEVSINTVVKEGALEKPSMPSSKILSMFAERKEISMRQALLELRKRSGFISKLKGSGQEDAYAAVQEYIMNN